MKPRRVFLFLAVCALGLGGCATPPRDPGELAIYKANNDPLEPFNRKIFAFNMAFDRAVVKPVARAYLRIVPKAGRDGLHNFVANLGEPVVFANDFLQGDSRRAGKTLARFVVNSTAGVAGVADVAVRHRLPRQTGDFGQTLHVWGFGEGPYLVLPLAGPLNPRDGVGRGVDYFLDPFRYIAAKSDDGDDFTLAEGVAAGIDERSRNLDVLDTLQRESIDYYAAFRSLYRQNREAELKTGAERSAPPPADLYQDPGGP